jgi:TetR/AcrR family transcriptional repressor of nem operon
MVGSVDTRERILDSAARLIQTRSYHGFSFQDIAEEVGIRKASLYHYFASKDAVALAVLNRATASVTVKMEKLAQREPIERLEGYFDMFRVLHRKGERMCPGGAFGSVFDAVSSSVQAALHRFAKLHLDLLEGIVREGVERGQFQTSDQRPRNVAMQIAAGVQGALLMGRLTGDPHVLDTVAAEFRSYLGYVPTSPPQTHADKRTPSIAIGPPIEASVNRQRPR